MPSRAGISLPSPGEQPRLSRGELFWLQEEGIKTSAKLVLEDLSFSMSISSSKWQQKAYLCRKCRTSGSNKSYWKHTQTLSVGWNLRLKSNKLNVQRGTARYLLHMGGAKNSCDNHSCSKLVLSALGCPLSKGSLSTNSSPSNICSCNNAMHLVYDTKCSDTKW